MGTYEVLIGEEGDGIEVAHHGYVAISPNLYAREGHGSPEDVAAKVRAAGVVPDDQVVGDIGGAVHGGTPLTRTLVCEQARMAERLPALLIEPEPDRDRD